jgi:Ca2+-binding RTX toxin-like protein
MPKLTESRNETWYLEDFDYSRWEVVEGVTVDATNGGSGIRERAEGSNIVLNGTVVARPANGTNEYVGIEFNAYSSTVTIGITGYVNSRFVQYGVWTENDGGIVTNHGLIEALKFGIYGDRGMDVANDGTIRAEYAVFLEEGNFNVQNAGLIEGTEYGISGRAGDYSTIVNERTGKIWGDDAGIALGDEDGGFASIINRGVIGGDDYSIAAANNTLEVINRGKLVGDVYLGAGADIFDTRGGKFNDEVYGNLGNDTYVVDRASISIREEAGEGDFDLVQSTATFHLGDNIEALQLIGKKNINGFANDQGATLTGNIGKNTLKGGDGADALYGVRGDDRLIGGGGADVFVFGLDYDRDSITDFQDGIDTVWLLGITTQQQLDALKIRQIGDDLQIDVGRGDRLMIDDLRKQDFTLDDLLLP